MERAVLRSIPAWAGKPCGAEPAENTDEVYPRVGGETLQATLLLGPEDGLSPRGRGNRG